MSLSNNTEITNPAQRFFEWSGDKGHFTFYDKEKKVKVDIPLPVSFIVLDTLSTISGFSDADNSGFWSNEIRDIKKESFIVRNKKGKQFEGNYDALKSANINGVKYCQSVYVAFKNNENHIVIGNIKMVGSSLSAWIDFRKANKIMGVTTVITSFVTAKKGKTEYCVPVFKTVELSKSGLEIAIELDKELQEYLTAYFAKNKITEIENRNIETVINESVNDIYGSSPEDLFVDEQKSMKDDVLNRNEPIQYDDLPF